MNPQSIFPVCRKAVGVFLAYIVIMLGVFLFVSDGYPTTPPAGWTIQMRTYPEKEYRWVRPNGTGNFFHQSNYEDAVNSAWSMFEFSRFNRSGDWKRAEAP